MEEPGGTFGDERTNMLIKTVAPEYSSGCPLISDKTEIIIYIGRSLCLTTGATHRLECRGFVPLSRFQPHEPQCQVV